ncbi:MAG TPA: transcriptional regulator NrdR [Clostridiales bacterium]|jgi:transcriptional repressor NrdR|nr:transcriptional regulator NrdR [Clostridiales bacterium]HBE13877.1 transcriptional regulator NrdR [Clostridiales bacterium]HCG35133.1 transcriptional regulator NrdR [Clostridiales bacterium]
MKCPVCGYTESKVLDSRSTEEGAAIRRRRECLECQKRFTTYERIETIPLVVVKKDKSRQAYDRTKILNGIMRACEKRPVSFEQMENMVSEIEAVLNNGMQSEVNSAYIGELVMEKLRKADEVAYVRFASVYRHFKDIGTFMNELKTLLEEQEK